MIKITAIFQIILGCIIAHPAKILFGITTLTSLIISTGGINYDTSKRLQVTRWIWSGEPQVKPDDTSLANNLVGRNGEKFAQFGIGQSLVMLPGDIFGFFISKIFPNKIRQEIRILAMWILTFPAINSLGILSAFYLGIRLGACTVISFLSSLLLLFGTTFLHYCQNPQENNLLFMLLCFGFLGGITWVEKSNYSSMFIAAFCLGYALLVRITMIIPVVVIFFSCWYMVIFINRPENLRNYFRTFLVFGFPTFALFLLLERGYHWYRFGNFSTTYAKNIVLAFESANLNFPSGYPFGFPFFEGFIGPFFDVEKSIFIFDPLLFLGSFFFICPSIFWSKKITSVFISSIVIMLGTIGTYASSYWWSGDSAWGCRHCAPSVQLVCLIGIILFLIKTKEGLTNKWFIPSVLLILISIVFQILSLCMDYNVENAQREISDRPLFVHYERLLNLTARSMGTFEINERNMGSSVVLNLSENQWFFALRLEPFVSSPIATCAKFIWISIVILLSLASTLLLTSCFLNLRKRKAAPYIHKKDIPSK